MNNRSLLIVAVVVVVVAGASYVLGHRNNPDNAPQGVVGNAMAGLSDKITQASDQAKADADEQSARRHLDAAKAGMGITPASSD